MATHTAPSAPTTSGQPPTSGRTAGDLEVPRPLRLLGTAGLSLTESVGLPAAAYLVAAWLSTAATIALVIAGAGASTLWFLSVLRRLGLRLRFAPA